MKFSVCVGSACHVRGSYNILCTLRQLVEEFHLHDQVQVASMFCDGNCCTDGVKVLVDETETVSLTGAAARDFFFERCGGLINQ